MLEAELAKERQEKQGLLKLNEDMEKNAPRTIKSSSKFMTRLSKSLDKKYISLALAVERKLASWASNETMEIIDSEDEWKKRNWYGRMQKVSTFGIALQRSGSSSTQ